MAEEEKKRIEVQRARLGEKGLAEKATELEKAMEFNEVCIFFELCLITSKIFFFFFTSKSIYVIILFKKETHFWIKSGLITHTQEISLKRSEDAMEAVSVQIINMCPYITQWLFSFYIS